MRGRRNVRSRFCLVGGLPPQLCNYSFHFELVELAAEVTKAGDALAGGGA